ncbi:hypothetical protein ACJDU8_24215 [Clostridium sp. WILCCON 0269]|uniref:Uncharacterized protein n=1 Tax=Candidatus Clostridium eludens TaxID=3381663 RepID=A0ABW8SRM6_9CLOT
MSNNIDFLTPYLYTNALTTNNQVSENPLLDSDNTDNSASDLGLDSVMFSPGALSTLNSSQTSSTTDTFNSTLDNLVSNGTITADQENSVKSAFISAKNSFSSYSNTTSQFPLDKLVSNGTITQEQENSIKSALISAKKSSYYNKIEKQAQIVSKNPMLSENPELYINSDLYQQNNTIDDDSDISDTSILNQL